MATPLSPPNSRLSASTVIQWTHRPHNFQFGADIRRQESNSISQSNPRGGFTFTGAATQQTVNGVPVTGTGSDFADFLLGTPDTGFAGFRQCRQILPVQFRRRLLGGRLASRVGSDHHLSLRWEYGSPPTELYGRLVNLDIAPGYTADAQVLGS